MARPLQWLAVSVVSTLTGEDSVDIPERYKAENRPTYYQGESYTGSGGNGYRVTRKGPGDTSPAWRGRYNHNCPGCYGGFCHSTEYHAQFPGPGERGE